LKAKYPDAHFLGTRRGDELASLYASADAFVFPSKTDTFGNVILEALASGCPVAALPVTGPIDIVSEGRGGVLSWDLKEAALAALEMSRQTARQRALEFDWAECARQFLEYSIPCDASVQRMNESAHSSQGSFSLHQA
jgi:glycosyltransferase involved in cell wall biosynthesis